MRLDGIASTLNGAIKHDQDALARRFIVGGDAHGLQEVHRAIGTHGRRGAHGPRQHDWLLAVDRQVQEICCLLHRVCAVRDDDAVHPGTPVKDAARDLHPFLGLDIGAVQAHQVADLDGIIGAQVLNLVFEDLAACGHKPVLGIDRGDRAAGGDEQDFLIVFVHAYSACADLPRKLYLSLFYYESIGFTSPFPLQGGIFCAKMKKNAKEAMPCKSARARSRFSRC